MYLFLSTRYKNDFCPRSPLLFFRFIGSMIQITALGEGDRDDSPPVDIGSSGVLLVDAAAAADDEPTEDDDEDLRTVP